MLSGVVPRHVKVGSRFQVDGEEVSRFRIPTPRSVEQHALHAFFALLLSNYGSDLHSLHFFLYIFQGDKGWVHYVGPVASAANASAVYVGVEWDLENRGKHNGTLGGKE